MLQVCQIIDASNAQSSSSNLYPAVLSILDQFPLVLALLTDLPPSRSCNHSIPLIPGAQPVFIRPYRYPLRIKDEIEARVKETLEQGLIQPSTTPFSSPMLLVKKKDDSYYFCVDFR
jgi:hypothetical protein